MQTNRLPYLLPAIGLLLVGHPVAAQQRLRVTRDGEWFHQTADGRRLARLARGAIVTLQRTDGDWAEVMVDGWIFASSVAQTARDGFSLEVTRAPEENLRSAPQGALVAKLDRGFLLNQLERQGEWIRAQRAGWVRRGQLEPVAVVVSNRTAPAVRDSVRPAPDTGAGGLTPGPRPGVRGGGAAGAGDSAQAVQPTPLPGPPPATVDPRRAVTRGPTKLFRAPASGATPPAGTVEKGTPVRVLGRDGEWARVQFEGWVRTEDLAPGGGVLQGVTAAELRANPEAYQGQVVRWDLQYIALATADELRPEIPPGSRYFLARGPLPERGFVYVVVPPARLAQIEALAPLASVTIVARIRATRGRFMAHPVVELVSVESASS